MTRIILLGLSDPWQWRLLWAFEGPEPFTWVYSVAALINCIYRITALRPTEPENYHGWQRSFTFQLLLSVNNCENFVQTAKASPSVSKIHYYLPENGKCIDSACSMMAHIYWGNGGISPRFLNFGTSCRWPVTFPRWLLYTRYTLAVSWWALEAFFICFIRFYSALSQFSTHDSPTNLCNGSTIFSVNYELN
jgi:hypothetical protein